MRWVRTTSKSPLAQIAAEAELPARARQHHRPHRGIAAAGHGGREQIHCDLEIQGVSAIGPVESQQRDGAAGLNLNAGSRHTGDPSVTGSFIRRDFHAQAGQLVGELDLTGQARVRFVV